MKRIPIVGRDGSGKIVAEFWSLAEASAAGYVQQSISACLAGDRNKHRGLGWERMPAEVLIYRYLEAGGSFESILPMLSRVQEWSGADIDREEFSRAWVGFWNACEDVSQYPPDVISLPSVRGYFDPVPTIRYFCETGSAYRNITAQSRPKSRCDALPNTQSQRGRTAASAPRPEHHSAIGN